MQISEDAKDLIKKILVLEPSKRPNLDDISAHPFIKTHQIKPTLSQLPEPNTSTIKKPTSLQVASSAKDIQGLPSDRACNSKLFLFLIF